MDLLCIFAAQNAALNPSQVLASLLSKRTKLQDELRGIEKQVFFFPIIWECAFWFLGSLVLNDFIFLLNQFS